MNAISNLPCPETAMQTLSCIMQRVTVPPKDERRIANRQQLLIPMTYQPLNEDLTICGDAANALSRDICVSGIGFFATEEIKAEFLRLEFHPENGEEDFEDIDPSELSPIFGKVIHQSKSGPVYLVGCQILTNWV